MFAHSAGVARSSKVIALSKFSMLSHCKEKIFWILAVGSVISYRVVQMQVASLNIILAGILIQT